MTLLVAMLPLQPVQGGWVFDTELGAGYDDNVGNSERKSDIQGDAFAAFGFRADRTKRLSEQTSVLMRGSLAVETWDEFEGLDNGRLGAMLRFIHQRDPKAPVIAFWGSAALWQFDSELRDGSEYRAGIFTEQAVSPALSGRLSLAAPRRNADSAVFDLDGASLGVDLDWRAGENLIVYGGTQFREGEVFSVSSPSPQILDASEARAPDDVFGGTAVAYRLDASSWVHTLGFNYGLSRSLSLDLQAQAIDTNAAGRNEYERWIAIGSLLGRF
jgi:hypothetical protein